MRRRRQMALAALVVVLLLVGAVVIINRDDGGEKAGTRAGSGDTSSTSVTTSVTTSPTTQPGASTTSASQPATTASPGTGPPSTVALALPEADPKAPPDPPGGLYRDGKVQLVGSVPSAAIAIRYQRKIEAILGRGNVSMAMQRDPRVPAGPLRIIVEEAFRFPKGSFVVDPKYNGLLNLGVIALKRLPEARLVVTGYTDNVGSAAVNQSLSEQRAQVVADWMIRGGIPATRVVALGRGPADPIATNSTPAGQDKNRRVEATLEGITP